MAKGKRNIRTLPANRVDYILSNYPADEEKRGTEIDGAQYTKPLWTEAQVIRAIEAGIKAGARDRRKQELESPAPFIPFKKAKWKDVVGEIRIPLHVMMLKGANQGSIPMSYVDNIMEVNVDGEKIAEAGGALFGSVYMKIGENSFGCSGKELLNAFFKWLDEHPDYRDYADGKTPLGKIGE